MVSTKLREKSEKRSTVTEVAQIQRKSSVTRSPTSPSMEELSAAIVAGAGRDSDE
jgi:hypothetical protein